MENHAIILSTDKINNSDAINKELVSGLIMDRKVHMEYFGIEPDNQADYLDSQMQEEIERKTMINIYFESDKIVYNSFSEDEICLYALNLINNPEVIVESISDVNDIYIYG